MSRQEAIEKRKKDLVYQKAVTDAWEEFIDNEVSDSILDPMTLDGVGYDVQIVFHGLLGLAIEENEAFVHVLKDIAHKQVVIVKKGLIVTGKIETGLSHSNYQFFKISHFQELVGGGNLAPNRNSIASMDYVNDQNERNSLSWLADPSDFLESTDLDVSQVNQWCDTFKFSKGRIRTLAIEGLGPPTCHNGSPELYTWPNGQKRGMARSITIEFKHEGDLVFHGLDGSEVLKIKDPAQSLAIHVVNSAASDGAATHFKAFYKLYRGSPSTNGPHRAHFGDGSYLRFGRKGKLDFFALNDACPVACFKC